MHRVKRDTLVLRVPKDKKEAKVSMEVKGHQVSGAAKDHLGQEATQGPQASDRKGIKVLKGNLDLLDLLGPLDQKVNQVFRVSVVRQEYLDQRVIEGFKDFKDSKVNLVKKESGVCEVNLVFRVCKDHQERKVRKDPWDFLDKMVKKDQEVTKDPLDPLDSGVLLGLLEMLGFQEHQVFKDHQEFQEILVDPEQKVNPAKQGESSMQPAQLLLASKDHLDLLAPLALQVLQDYQVPLALLVCPAHLVLKVTEDLRESRERLE